MCAGLAMHNHQRKAWDRVVLQLVVREAAPLLTVQRHEMLLFSEGTLSRADCLSHLITTRWCSVDFFAAISSFLACFTSDFTSALTCAT